MKKKEGEMPEYEEPEKLADADNTRIFSKNMLPLTLVYTTGGRDVF